MVGMFSWSLSLVIWKMGVLLTDAPLIGMREVRGEEPSPWSMLREVGGGGQEYSCRGEGWGAVEGAGGGSGAEVPWRWIWGLLLMVDSVAWCLLTPVCNAQPCRPGSGHSAEWGGGVGAVFR